MKFINKYNNNIVIDYTADDACSIVYENTVKNIDFVNDPTYNEIYNLCKTIYPDFTWNYFGEYSKWDGKAILLSFFGRYTRKGKESEYNTDFNVKMKVRCLDAAQKQYVLMLNVDRDYKKIHVDIEKYAENCQVNFCDGIHVLAKNHDMVLRIAENLLKSKKHLADKYVENDKKVRIDSAKAQMSLDIDMLDIKEKLVEIGKANNLYCINEINSLTVRTYYYDIQHGGKIGITLDGLTNKGKLFISLDNFNKIRIKNEYAILGIMKNQLADQFDKEFSIDSAELLRNYENMCKTYDKLNSTIRSIKHIWEM